MDTIGRSGWTDALNSVVGWMSYVGWLSGCAKHGWLNGCFK